MQNSFTNEAKYKRVFEIIDKRWNEQLHRPLHAAGNILNPELYYENTSLEVGGGEVWKGFFQCVAKLVPNVEEQDRILNELPQCKEAAGLFGYDMTIRQRKKISPVSWWSQFGGDAPHLQKFAIKVLSLTCSSSGCERNWSVFEHIHSKKRNRLALKRLNDLVFVKYNRTLRRRWNLRDKIDPIIIHEIDESNEWLIETPKNHDDEEVFEGDSTFTWGNVAEASGVNENLYGLRGSSSSRGRGKQVASSSRYSLIDEVDEVDEVDEIEEEDEEDDEQYKDDDEEISDDDNLSEDE